MSFEYAQDKRTLEQVKKDYDYGKEKEAWVFNKLPYYKYLINEDDKFGRVLSYKPDCFILLNGYWTPTEIKHTDVELKYIEYKKNQVEYLAKIGGVIIQSTPTRYSIQETNKLIRHSPLSIGYCNKPCYKVLKPEWRRWENI